jgi:hypothetical protein
MSTRDELDPASIVRPELFITADVCGMTIPVTIQAEDGIRRVWQLYLHWAAGRRECLELPKFITLPDGKRLWFLPSIGQPPSDMETGWSQTSRQAWLDGAPLPTPESSFDATYEFVDTHLDLTKTEGVVNPISMMVAFVFSTYHDSPFCTSAPYILFTGQENSGKTRALKVLRALVFRPAFAVAPEPFKLAEYLHCYGGTLLLDEMERFRPRECVEKEMLEILDEGYYPGDVIHRLKVVNGVYHPVAFNVFGPKAIASRIRLPEKLVTRCIHYQMAPSDTTSKKALRQIHLGKAQAIRDLLHTWALSYSQTKQRSLSGFEYPSVFFPISLCWKEDRNESE